jgi:hypothetical protein
MNPHVVSQKRTLMCSASDVRALTSSQVHSGPDDDESPSKSRTKTNADRQLAGQLATKREGPQKFASIFSRKARQLAALHRYERRALSRRKLAMRAFDAARIQAIRTPS